VKIPESSISQVYPLSPSRHHETQFPTGNLFWM
jgi:hypothetical protein